MPTEKQRRYTRYEIKLAATLIINNASFVQCMIRDFCSGGLFLETLQPSSVSTLKPNQKIQIIFTVNLKQGGDNFSVDATIMHIRANGIGVAFANNSNLAFESLKNEALNALGLKSTEGRSNRISSSQQKNLEVDLVSLFQDMLPVIIRSFYQRTEVKLKKAAEQVENLPFSADILDATFNLETNRDLILESFYTNILENCHLTSSVSEKSSTDSPLSLIDKHDFEDWLNMLAVIRNLESVYEYQLEQLLKKIAYVIGVGKNKVINPVCPEKICGSFRETLTAIEKHAQVKRILYPVFEETLRDFLSDLYVKMEAILIAHGAPEKIVDVPEWKKVNPGKDQADNHHRQTGQTNSIATPQQTAIATVNDSQISTPPALSNQESKQIVNVASNLLHLIQGQNSSQQKIAATETVSLEYSANEISLALAQLQEKQNTANTSSSSPLQKELLDSLRSVSSTQKNLSSTDKNNIEVYECLFETLFKDMLLDMEISSYLKRIHLPVIDQAMQDSSMPIRLAPKPTRGSMTADLYWASNLRRALLRRMPASFI